MDALVAGHVLFELRGKLVFSQPVVREAVLAQLGPGARAALHATAARTLHDSGASVSRVAAHVAYAPMGTLPGAADLLCEAAASLLADGDALAASKYLNRALEHAPSDAAIEARLGYALLAAGEPERARVHLRSAARAAADRRAQADLLAAAASATSLVDGPAVAVRELRALLAGWPPSDADPARLVLEARHAAISLDAARGEPGGRRALAPVRRAARRDARAAHAAGAARPARALRRQPRTRGRRDRRPRARRRRLPRGRRRRRRRHGRLGRRDDGAHRSRRARARDGRAGPRPRAGARSRIGAGVRDGLQRRRGDRLARGRRHASGGRERGVAGRRRRRGAWSDRHRGARDGGVLRRLGGARARRAGGRAGDAGALRRDMPRRAADDPGHVAAGAARARRDGVRRAPARAGRGAGDRRGRARRGRRHPDRAVAHPGGAGRAAPRRASAGARAGRAAARARPPLGCEQRARRGAVRPRARRRGPSHRAVDRGDRCARRRAGVPGAVARADRSR